MFDSDIDVDMKPDNAMRDADTRGQAQSLYTVRWLNL